MRRHNHGVNYLVNGPVIHLALVDDELFRVLFLDWHFKLGHVRWGLMTRINTYRRNIASEDSASSLLAIPNAAGNIRKPKHDGMKVFATEVRNLRAVGVKYNGCMDAIISKLILEWY
jgi:hypothetical protein